MENEVDFFFGFSLREEIDELDEDGEDDQRSSCSEFSLGGVFEGGGAGFLQHGEQFGEHSGSGVC